MGSLNIELKQLIFDYCMGQLSQEQNAEIEALISTNQEAAKIYNDFKAALSPLDSLEVENCPDYIVEQTVNLVNEHISSSQKQLQRLIENEQARKIPVKIGLWRNFSEMAAAAAAILIIVGVLVPTLGTARQKYLKNSCQAQLSSIFRGFNSYVENNNGQLPAVKMASGSPWYKVGNQGNENHSNTRHLFLLVKGNYVDSRSFCCPGTQKGKITDIDQSQLQQLKDFPQRSCVTYSFRISCSSTKDGNLTCRKVILADMNPLFEVLPSDSSVTFTVQLNREQLKINSNNHKQSGQNVLLGDGSVVFLKTRYMNNTDDDIYTLQDTDIYQGFEVPSIPTDFFLAP
jgi:hypothetical protein